MKTLSSLPHLYPKAFESAEGNPYAIGLFGIECGNGWYDLIEPIVKAIHEFNERAGKEYHPIVIEQIKEKFGSLRFYAQYATDEIYNMIEAAETASETTCELCGKPSKRYKENFWLYNRCEDCKKNEKPL